MKRSAPPGSIAREVTRKAIGRGRGDITASAEVTGI